MKAILALEDGTIFEGESLGAAGRAGGEVVFNTGMTGYQEILTDPSYSGQIVALTYPLIGNYGVNADDFESRRVQVEGFVVRECEAVPSNWRSAQSLDAFLKERGIVGIQGVDTRALTRALREKGVMMGAISTEETVAEALERLAVRAALRKRRPCPRRHDGKAVPLDAERNPSAGIGRTAPGRNARCALPNCLTRLRREVQYPAKPCREWL